ncbi:hypothetical protein XENOCAPTIV_020209 [Xenoophorus captivus]|uniref:Uncharacterized protein n=1 Tax=Xenoophorus captivus TaxID=1517983 RepID=A0ABV0S0U1_9TELE
MPPTRGLSVLQHGFKAVAVGIRNLIHGWCVQPESTFDVKLFSDLQATKRFDQLTNLFICIGLDQSAVVNFSLVFILLQYICITPRGIGCGVVLGSTDSDYLTETI